MQNHAADITYIANSGPSSDSIFTLSDINTTPDEKNAINITWKTSTASKSTLRYWPDTIFGNLTSFFLANHLTETDYISEHNMHLEENLNANQQYKFTVTMTTKFGDTFGTPVHTFKTQ